MKILVSGGAGFIGSALVRHIILNTDFSVVNVDKITYAGNLDSLKSVYKSHKYFFERVDICDKVELRRVFHNHKPDVVMHLAAESHVDRSIDSPDDFIQTNIVGTFNMLEVARAYWLDLAEVRKSSFKFLHISTDEVFGDLKIDDAPFSETTSYAPSSPYSASKAASDHLVRAWNRTYKLPTIITNCSNNYGPFHYPEKLIPLVILNALDRKPIPIYGAGNQIRDWLYVEDHVRGLIAVVTKGKIGQTYNIGGNNEKTNMEVVSLICNLLDELVPLNSGSYQSHITHVSDRPGHDKRYAIDASKITNELQWSPEETFESGIRKTVEWYLENSEWCRNLQNIENIRQRRGNHL